MPKQSLPMVGGCGCNDDEAAACGCRDEAEARGLELLKNMNEVNNEVAPENVGPASKDAEGC